MIATFGSEAVVAPVAVAALIDSGAAITVSTGEMASFLEIRSVGVVSLHTPTTVEPVLCRQFHVNFYFSRGFAIENLLVVEVALTGQPFQCLIGRVLSRGVFTYNGKENRFSLLLVAVPFGIAVYEVLRQRAARA